VKRLLIVMTVLAIAGAGTLVHAFAGNSVPSRPSWVGEDGRVDVAKASGMMIPLAEGHGSARIVGCLRGSDVYAPPPPLTADGKPGREVPWKVYDCATGLIVGHYSAGSGFTASSR
jgi:hypothetical protein